MKRFLLVIFICFSFAGTAHAQELHQDEQGVWRAKVIEVTDATTETQPWTDLITHRQTVTALLINGEREGETVTFSNDFVQLEEGDRFFLVYTKTVDGVERYSVQEVDRTIPLIILGLIFVAGVLDGTGNTGVVYFNRSDFPTLEIEHYDLAKVKVKNSKAMADARTALVGMGFTVSSVSDVVSQANKIFSAIQIALGVFGTFALIVAAIGLINTMTISLLERINEIGIMRAIGAAPQDIRKIFLVESTLIGFFGGLSGIILGIIGSEILNFGFNILARSFGGVYTRLFAYPLWFIFFIILLSTCVGFFGGFWPARRAAKMNPLQALRYK